MSCIYACLFVCGFAFDVIIFAFDDGDTGNVRLAITINKAQGQSLEKCGIDLNTGCFPMVNYYVACSRVGKPDNLFVWTDNRAAKNVVYSQVLRS